MTAWLGTWAFRRKFTIANTNVDANQTHFPMLMTLGVSVGTNNADVTDIFDEVGASSLKIAITDDTGDTELFVEIEQFDNIAEVASLWCSRSDWVVTAGAATIIYIYFDSAQPDNTGFVGPKESAPGEAVWDSSYKGVWHLNETVSTLADHYKDSTSNDADGTLTENSAVTAVTGQIDGATDFDGDATSPDFITVAGFASNFTAAITMSGWIRPALTDADGEEGYFGIRDDDPSLDSLFILQRDGTNNLQYRWRNSLGVSATETAVNVVTGGVFVFVAITYDGDDMVGYVDGVEVVRDTGATGIMDSSEPFRIGCDGAFNAGAGSARALDGTADEVRASNVARSAADIKVEFFADDDDIGAWGPTMAMPVGSPAIMFGAHM